MQMKALLCRVYETREIVVIISQFARQSMENYLGPYSTPAPRLISPNPTLDNRSSLYYERGFNPITPIDTITSLPTQGMRDKCPKDVTKRLEYLDNMRSIVQDKLSYALNSYEHYYNARRNDDTRITVGSLVRLNLDHIKLQIFRNRPTSKLNPLWY